MDVVQVMMEQRTERGKHVRMGWLPVEPRLKCGVEITLKDEPLSGRWKVVQMYARQDSEDIPRKWGLDLPKNQRTER